ncbi:MAG: PAS domain-containing protein [Rectinemataceae bacterium]
MSEKPTAAFDPLLRLDPRRRGALILLLALFVAGAVIFGFVQRNKILEDAQNTLGAVAELKVGQIRHWRLDHYNEALETMSNSFLVDRIKLWMAEPSEELEKANLERLRVLATHYGYSETMIVNPEARILLSDKGTEILDLPTIEAMRIAEATGKPAFSELHNTSPRGLPGLDMVVPLLLDSGLGAQHAFACLVFRIDPRTDLYPMIEKWPTPSSTAETLLVRREGESILFLNNLRHFKGSILTFSIPIERRGTPAVEAVLGHNGSLIGSDYRGKRVLALTQKVPDTPWYMVTKIDMAEVMKPWMIVFLLLGVLLVGLILGVIALTLAIVQNKAMLHYRTRLSAEAAMRSSEAKFLAFMEHMPSLVFIKDQANHLIYANPRMRETFPVEGWDGKHPNELFPADLADQVLHSDAEALAWGHARFEEARIDKAGRLRFFDSEKFRIDRNGEGPLIGAVMSDITERRAAERGLSELGEIFRLFLKNNPIYVFIKDESGRAIFLSDNYGEMLGFPVEDALGKTMEELFPPEMARKMHEDDMDVLHGGLQQDIIESKDDRTFSTIKFPISIQGVPKYIAGYTIDITDRVRSMEALSALNETLEERVRERTIQLETTNQELESFAYSVSHDLRAPLRAMNGFTNVLLQRFGDSFDEEGRHYLERIKEASNRMGKLIADLLALSRVTRTEFNRSDVDLSALAGEIVSELRKNDPDRKIEVVIDPDMRVRADAGLMRPLFDNLIGNAWKFTSGTENAHIHIGSVVSGGQDGRLRREWFISDNGAGFDMAYAGKLYTPFQRLHSTTEFPGTGIGLAIVRRIITRHGGSIRAEAAPGEGASFYFTLDRFTPDR